MCVCVCVSVCVCVCLCVCVCVCVCAGFEGTRFGPGFRLAGQWLGGAHRRVPGSQRAESVAPSADDPEAGEGAAGFSLWV